MRTWLACALIAVNAAAGTIVAPEGHPVDARRGMAISPDGAWVAFVVNGIEGDRVAIESTADAANVRILDGTAGARRPFWSPDGHAIAYFTDADLRAVSVDGGRAEVLCRCHGRSGSWSARGILLSTREAGPIQLLDVRSGALRPVTALPKPAAQLDRSTAINREYFHQNPRFMPDGEHFLYIAGSYGYSDGKQTFSPRSDLYLGDFAGRRRLIATDVTDVAPLDAGTIVFSRGFSIFAADLGTLEERPLFPATQINAFDANGEGAYAQHVYGPIRSQLVRIDRDGLNRKAISPLGEIRRPRISRDGKLVAYEDGAELVVTGIDGGRELIRMQSILFGGAAWSPDGTQIAAPLMIDGKCRVAIVKLAGGAIAPLSDCAPVFDWSPDGRFIAVELHEGVKHDFDFVTTDGGVEQRRFFKDKVEGWLRFSPDGSAIAVDAKQTSKYDDATGSAEGYRVYVIPIDANGNATSAPAPVSGSPSYRPVWNGKDLFFVGRGQRLYRMEATSPPRVLDVTPLSLSDFSFGDYDVSPDGRTLVIVEMRDAIQFMGSNDVLKRNLK